MGLNLFICSLLLITIYLINHSFCSLQFEQLNNSTIQAILEHPKVTLQISSQQIAIQNYKRNFYVIKVFSKNKKQAYRIIRLKFDQIFQILKNKVIVPDDPSFVTSKLYHHYLKNKKVWQFQKIFIVQGLQVQVNRVDFDLIDKGAIKLAENVDNQFMAENSQFIKMFISARQQVKAAIARFGDLYVLKGRITSISNDQNKNQSVVMMKLRDSNQQQSDSGKQLQDQIVDDNDTMDRSAKYYKGSSEAKPQDLFSRQNGLHTIGIQDQQIKIDIKIVFSVGLVIDDIQIRFQKPLNGQQTL